jgi:DNA-binding response OmpR family regulator
MIWKVCVIDDDPMMLEHVGDMLKAMGHEVFLARSVVEGLQMTRDNAVDAAVVDILMPDRDGLNYIMEIGRDRPLRIVAITGGGRLGPSMLLKMAEGLGAHATLVKPFSSDELRAALALT